MVQLSDLYNADRYARDPEIQDLRAEVEIPLHSVICPDCYGRGFVPPDVEIACLFCGGTGWGPR